MRPNVEVPRVTREINSGFFTETKKNRDVRLKEGQFWKN